MDTTNVDYSRQAGMDADLPMNALRNTTHIIIGCGGIGFWLGMFLAMNGCEKFILIDGDKIDRSSLNRLPVPARWIGKRKTLALSTTIRVMRPNTVITRWDKDICENTIQSLKETNTLIYNHYQVWDCTDNVKIQKLLTRAFAERYIKIGYEGFKIGVYDSFDVWIDENDYSRGYRTTMANSMSSAMSAIMGVMYKLNGLRGDTLYNLTDIAHKGVQDALGTNESTNSEGMFVPVAGADDNAQQDSLRSNEEAVQRY